MEKDCEKFLEKKKKEYKIFSDKYSLPDWKNLEENFDISKAFGEEGSLILKDIRRKMNEKIVSYLHLFESFLNPQTTPLFIMNVLKNIDEKDLENIREVYKGLAKVQFKQILVDISYSEEKEVELIKTIFEIWEKEKRNLEEIIKVFDRKYTESSLEKKKSYFG